MARCSPGQSAWSDSTKPRSTLRRRRAPRNCIQPLAKASLCSPKRLSQALPCTDGGAITSARFRLALSGTSLTRFVSGNETPAVR